MNLPIPAEMRVPEKLIFFFFYLIWFSQNICRTEVGIPPHTIFMLIQKKPAGFLVFEQMTEKSVQHMRAVIAESSADKEPQVKGFVLFF